MYKIVHCINISDFNRKCLKGTSFPAKCSWKFQLYKLFNKCGGQYVFLAWSPLLFIIWVCDYPQTCILARVPYTKLHYSETNIDARFTRARLTRIKWRKRLFFVLAGRDVIPRWLRLEESRSRYSYCTLATLVRLCM